MPNEQVVAKALKLFEALCEPHEQPEGDDHNWRECRTCLAREQLEYDSTVPIIRALLDAFAPLNRERANGWTWVRAERLAELEKIEAVTPQDAKGTK